MENIKHETQLNTSPIPIKKIIVVFVAMIAVTLIVLLTFFEDSSAYILIFPAFLFLLGFPIIVILTGLHFFLKNKSNQGGDIVTSDTKLKSIFNPRILSIYVILWGFSFFTFLFAASGVMGESYSDAILLFIVFGGMLFPGLYLIVNNSENVWKSIPGYIIMAVVTIIFLMFLSSLVYYG